MADLEVLWSKVQPCRIDMDPELLKAARRGKKDILDELLRREARALEGDIEKQIPEDATNTSCLLGVTHEGNTALHIVASKGHLELAEEICRKEKSLLAAPNMWLDTPLHCAARFGHDEMVSLIIQSAKEDGIEARVLRATNMGDANALHVAAKYNQESVAKALMQEDAELASMLNDASMSPLYLAIVTRSIKVAKALLYFFYRKKTSVAFIAGPNEKTVLHAAVLLDREIARIILEWKPKLAKCVDSSLRTPLHYAASKGDRDAVKLLLDRDPSTAYISDANGLFPIHTAASMGNIPAVDQILERCPDAHELLDKEGKNFLHVAFQRRKLDVVKKILSKRSDLRKLLNEQDNKGNTPFHTAVQNGDEESILFLRRDREVNINILNYHGFTPLDLAIAKLEEGSSTEKTREQRIARRLPVTGAQTGLPESHDLERVELSSDVAKEKPSGDDDKSKEKSFSNTEKEINKDMAKSFAIVAVLVATVTFAAGFTLPGGYIADDQPGRGTAVLSKEYAFKVFLISDGFALACSIAATFWFTYAATWALDEDNFELAFYSALGCLWVAFSGMSTAFAMGTYVQLPPSCKSIRIFLCILALGAPPLTLLVMNRNFFSWLKTDTIREGLDIASICASIVILLPPFGISAIFFLLALL